MKKIVMQCKQCSNEGNSNEKGWSEHVCPRCSSTDLCVRTSKGAAGGVAAGGIRTGSAQQRRWGGSRGRGNKQPTLPKGPPVQKIVQESTTAKLEQHFNRLHAIVMSNRASGESRYIVTPRVCQHTPMFHPTSHMTNQLGRMDYSDEAAQQQLNRMPGTAHARARSGRRRRTSWITGPPSTAGKILRWKKTFQSGA